MTGQGLCRPQFVSRPFLTHGKQPWVVHSRSSKFWHWRRGRPTEWATYLYRYLLILDWCVFLLLWGLLIFLEAIRSTIIMRLDYPRGGDFVWRSNYFFIVLDIVSKVSIYYTVPYRSVLLLSIWHPRVFVLVLNERFDVSNKYQTRTYISISLFIGIVSNSIPISTSNIIESINSSNLLRAELESENDD